MQSLIILKAIALFWRHPIKINTHLKHNNLNSNNVLKKSFLPYLKEKKKEKKTEEHMKFSESTRFLSSSTAE